MSISSLFSACGLSLLRACAVLALVVLLVHPARATQVLPLTVEESAQMAGGIFVGQVVQTQSRWGDVTQRWMTTECVYQVEQVIQPAPGVGAGGRVTLSYWGGTIGDQHQQISGLDLPVVGGRYVVMLRGDWPAPGFSPVVGLHKGCFTVVRDARTGQDVVQDAEGTPLADTGAAIGRRAELRSPAAAGPVTLARFVSWLRGNLPRIKARPLPVLHPALPEGVPVLAPRSQKPELPDLQPGTQRLFFSNPHRPLGAANNGSLQPASPFGGLIPAPAPSRAPAAAPGGGVKPHFSFIGAAADTPIVVNQLVPALFPGYSPEDQYQMSKWNAYANIFQVREHPTGTFGWQNDRFDIDGFLDDATVNNVYGKPWGDTTLAITFTLSDRGSGQIKEADIAFNAAFPSTLDDEYVYNNGQPAIYPFRGTMLHELGHMWGLDHQFNLLSIMNYSPYPYRAHCFPTVEDTAGMRSLYPGQAQTLKDLGIYLYYADGVQNYSDAAISNSVVAGQYLSVANYQVENLGTLSAAPTISWYLAPERNLDSLQFLSNSILNNVAPGQYTIRSTPTQLPVPHNMAPGSYYLLAKLDSDGGPEQAGFPFSNNLSWSRGKVVVQPAVQGLTLEPSAVFGTESSTATLTLTGPANAGGLSFNLSSSDAAATVPTTLTVPEGASSASFTVHTSTVQQNVNAFINAQGTVGNGGSMLQISPFPPPAPTNLTAVPTSGSNIKLDWLATGNISGFRLELSIGAGSSNWGTLDTVGAAVRSYAFTAQTPNQTYRFRVFAYNDGGASAASNIANAVAPGAPDAPSNLSLEVTAGDQVTLTWHDNSGNEDGFRIEQQTGVGGFAEVATAAANATSKAVSGLSAGVQYAFRVRAYNLGGNSAYTPQVAVKLLAAPSNLVATPLSPTAVDLKWKDNSSDESGFRIMRSNDLMPFQQVGLRSANQTDFHDTNVPPCKKFLYRVVAFNAQGNSGATSTVGFDSGCIPNAPTLILLNAPNSHQVDVSWSDNSLNELNFLVERRVGNAAFKQIGTTSAGMHVYSDGTVQPGTAYSYRVRATNAIGNSGYTENATVTPLAQPLNLKAKLNGGTVSLTWVDKANGEFQYQIQRKKGSDGYETLSTLPANATSFTDEGVEGCTTYLYRVRANGTKAQSSYSDEALLKTPCAPTAPSNLTLAYTSETGGVFAALKWKDNSANESGFVIQTRVDTGEWLDVGMQPANSTSFKLLLTDCNNHHFRVRATNFGGDSAYTNEAEGAPTCPPAAPSGLTATRSADGKSITLKWTDNSSNETKFAYERQIGTAAFQPAGAVNAGITTYKDQFLKPNLVYTYRVRAVNAGGFSAYSNVASPPVGAPTALSAPVVGATQARLSWTDGCQGETAYVVQATGDGGATYLTMTLPADSFAVLFTGLTPNTQYQFRVQAVKNDTGFSAFSNTATATTLPGTGPSSMLPRSAWVAATRSREQQIAGGRHKKFETASCLLVSENPFCSTRYRPRKSS